MEVRTFAALSLLAFSWACTSADEPSKTPPTPPANAASTKPTQPALPPSHPPIGQSRPLAFTAQEGWVTETPTSAMRKAQYKLPKQGGDAEDAKLVVYFFGTSQGGSTQDNINRWASEYEQPDGKSSADVVKQSTRKVNGMDVVEVDVSGTCVAETSPGSGERPRRENWRTLAAIIQSDHGSYFAKLMGPIGTVSHWETSFRKFVGDVKPSAN
jgi:hypothetical protein